MILVLICILILIYSDTMEKHIYLPTYIPYHTWSTYIPYRPTIYIYIYLTCLYTELTIYTPQQEHRPEASRGNHWLHVVYFGVHVCLAEFDAAVDLSEPVWGAFKDYAEASPKRGGRVPQKKQICTCCWIYVYIYIYMWMYAHICNNKFILQIKAVQLLQSAIHRYTS